jgi:hypothetical protein
MVAVPGISPRLKSNRSAICWIPTAAIRGRPVIPSKKVMAAERELSVENLSEDHWLVLDRPIPADADPQLLTAARDAAVVCQLELQLERPSSPDLKKIDSLLTDIRKRLGEPEPEPKPLDPEMKATLDELEKKWRAQPDKPRDRGRSR